MKSIKIISLLALLLIFIFGDSLIIPKFLRNGDKIYEELQKLKLEKEALEAQFLVQAQKSENFKTGRVFSSYPFNNQNELFIALGRSDGIKESMPAVVDENIVIGQVIRVFEKYSIVRTIFDPEWRMSVRIGGRAADSLLVGGPEPMLTMIDKNKPIKEGDVVYSAVRGFPYGALIGKAGEVIISPSAVFQGAKLILPYDLNNELTEVKILTDYGV